MGPSADAPAPTPDAAPLRSVALRDGSELVIYKLICPIDQTLRPALMALLNSEWADGDFHWSQSMSGEFSQMLTVAMCPAMRQGRWVGTASTVHPRRHPEVAAVCDVMTLAEMRGLGIARAAAQAVTEHALQQGARAVYLGSTRDGNAWRVYQRVGYQWVNGGVMRYLPDESASFEDDYFGTGQTVSVRPTQWGDLPGFSALFDQPYQQLAGDYVRGIMSPRHTYHPRCVSAFTTIHYAVEAAGGCCLSLIGQTPHRVLGVASVTPVDKAYRRHVGTLEIMTHDNHTEHGPQLLHATLDAARQLNLKRIVAYVPTIDTLKARWLRDATAQTVGALHDQIDLEDRSIDVELYEMAL